MIPFVIVIIVALILFLVINQNKIVQNTTIKTDAKGNISIGYNNMRRERAVGEYNNSFGSDNQGYPEECEDTLLIGNRNCNIPGNKNTICIGVQASVEGTDNMNIETLGGVRVGINNQKPEFMLDLKNKGDSYASMRMNSVNQNDIPTVSNSTDGVMFVTYNGTESECNFRSNLGDHKLGPASINDLQGVTMTNPVAGQLLVYNGSQWVNKTMAYGLFYALVLPDNSLTISIGAPVLFPRAGPSAGGIIQQSSGVYLLPDVGTYEVSWNISSVTEAAQVVLRLNNIEQAYTIKGRSTGTCSLGDHTMVTTTVDNSTISLCNVAANSTALTITPSAGGTAAVSCTLLIKQI